MTRLLRLAFLALVLAFAGDAPAFAQNQPVSTRPFKGPPFTAFTAVTSDVAEECNTTILDLRSYNSLILRVTPSAGTTEMAIFGVAGRYAKFCRQSQSYDNNTYHLIRAYYSEDGATNFFRAIAFNAEYITSAITAATTVTVVVTPVPDALLMATVGARVGLLATDKAPVLLGGLAGASGALGLPAVAGMAYAGTYGGAFTTRQANTGIADRCSTTSPNTAIASSSNGTKVADIDFSALVDSDYTSTDITIQNVGTVALYCKVATATSPPTITTSDYRVALAAGSVANDGTGGSVTITGVRESEAVFCLAASGTGSAAFFCR